MKEKTTNYHHTTIMMRLFNKKNLTLYKLDRGSFFRRSGCRLKVNVGADYKAKIEAKLPS